MFNLTVRDPSVKSFFRKITAVIVGSAGIYVIYKLYRKNEYRKLIERKRDILASEKDGLLRTLDNSENRKLMDDVTNCSLKELIHRMETGVYKASDVMKAYQLKALLMDKELNFITDLNPYVDEDVAACVNSKRSDLRGIPVSIKDCYGVNGCDCTFGIVSLACSPVDRDCAIVQALRMQGAIPFVVTNMCQSGYSIECSNPIFGFTRNPHNKQRTCGGSSGGEGAILGSGASILGMGNDIGGSVRIPATYCGIYSLKPTADRFSPRYVPELYPDENIIPVSFGPMARYMDDLVMAFKALTCGDLYNLDPYCPPVGFNEKIFSKTKPMKIGYYIQIGPDEVTPVPAVARGVRLAKAALERCGHTVVEFTIPDVSDAMYDLYFTCLLSDGGKNFMKYCIKDSPVDPSLSLLTTVARFPYYVNRLLAALMWPFNKHYSKGIKAICGRRFTSDLWKLKTEIDTYRDKVLSMLSNQNIDGLICPVMPVTAPPHGVSDSIQEIMFYTAIYNLLDYPAGCVPITKVEPGDIAELKASYPRNTPTHKKIYSYEVDSINMPVGVQCVSLPWREETCLRIMRDISNNM